MVMEIPTPQCVGREFVRQYYTLLNKAPLHLHRFYNHDSSFLHGGLEHPGQDARPVVGQHDIHERIMQLNFRDCHAKIVSVDSLETLNDGVVVQVSGELSNNGQPMRRFMQTFVLVPQSPKKYYVRNDIFRYQDEIFSEDDNELDNDETVTRTNAIDTEDDNAGYHENEIVRNGSVYPNDPVLVTGINDHMAKYTSPPQPPRETVPSPPPEAEEPAKSWDPSEEDDDEDLEEEDSAPEQIEEEPTPEILNESPPVVSQEPKTYANMVSKNASSNMVPMASIITNTSPVSTIPASQKMDHGMGYHHKSDATPPTQSGPNFGPRLSRPRLNSGRSNSGRFDGIHSDQSARSPEDQDGDRRGSSKPNFIHYPDTQQLFVGNLTHSITEDDLKQHFSRFGKVIDMRISNKQNVKMPGGAKVPNFGFIVFEDAESVQKVLEQKPIYFNDHRLNVEEKKRPKEGRPMLGDNRSGPPRGGPSPRMMGNRGPRGGGMMGQGMGRGENRGGMRGGFARR